MSKIDISACTEDTSIDSIPYSVTGSGRTRRLIVHTHPLTNRVQYTVEESRYFDSFEEAVKHYNEAESNFKMDRTK